MSTLGCQYNQPKRPGDFDLLTLKVVSESGVTWATSVPILVFLGLSLTTIIIHCADKLGVRCNKQIFATFSISCHVQFRGGGVAIRQRFAE